MNAIPAGWKRDAAGGAFLGLGLLAAGLAASSLFTWFGVYDMDTVPSFGLAAIGLAVIPGIAIGNLLTMLVMFLGWEPPAWTSYLLFALGNASVFGGTWLALRRGPRALKAVVILLWSIWLVGLGFVAVGSLPFGGLD